MLKQSSSGLFLGFCEWLRNISLSKKKVKRGYISRLLADKKCSHFQDITKLQRAYINKTACPRYVIMWQQMSVLVFEARWWTSEKSRAHWRVCTRARLGLTFSQGVTWCRQAQQYRRERMGVLLVRTTEK